MVTNRARLANHSMFKVVDSMCLRIMLMADCMELNTTGIHKSYKALRARSHLLPGGMGVHQLFWAHRGSGSSNAGSR